GRNLRGLSSALAEGTKGKPRCRTPGPHPPEAEQGAGTGQQIPPESYCHIKLPPLRWLPRTSCPARRRCTGTEPHSSFPAYRLSLDYPVNPLSELFPAPKDPPAYESYYAALFPIFPRPKGKALLLQADKLPQTPFSEGMRGTP